MANNTRSLFYAFQIYAKDAQLLWTKMMNLNDKSVTMSHDGYLKVYQLSKPTLWGYDCILIDEAQDMSTGKTCLRLYCL